MAAKPVEHRYYSTDRVFCIVECHECLAILNSGHHYSERELDLAQKVADGHNAARHPTT